MLLNNDNNTFNVFHLNIRSLRKHFDELLVFLNSRNKNFNLIILSEVWIKYGEENNYKIPGYDMLLQPRLANQAGGLVIYVTSGLHYQHHLIDLPSAEIINIVVSLTQSGKQCSVSFYGVYRSCKYPFSAFRDDFENILKLNSNPTIVIGDMNICLINDVGSGPEYINLISSYGFESYVNVPTRFSAYSESCLDHILVRNSKPLQFNANVIPCSITDHYALDFEISSTFLEIENKNTNYCKCVDYDLLRRLLMRSDWHSVYSNYSVNECVQNFYEIYNCCYESSCRLKKITRNNKRRNPWITDYLVRLVNSKNRIFKIYSKDKANINLKQQYISLSKTVTKEIRKAKLTYYSSVIEESRGDTKKYWQIIKSITHKNRDNITTINCSGNLVEVLNNEELVSDSFNDYFVNITSKLRQENFGSDLFVEKMVNDEVKLQNFSISYNNMLKIIGKMKNKKSYGIDGISILTIKRNLDIFAPILYHIFTISLTEGLFPDQFKTACVVPIFKAGSRAEMSSYRPISLINTIAKIFETIIKEQLLNYLLKNSLLSKNQYGFIPKKGVDLAVQHHIRCIAESVNLNKHTLAIYLDFKKAFDLVDINILLKRLRAYGIGGKALQILSTFSKGRKQVVKIKNQYSGVLELYNGVAQGGVLGPLLFICYINDLLNINDLNSTTFAYADDTALVISAYNKHNLLRLVQNDLDKISQWLANNKIIVNSSKSKCILFFDRFKTCDRLQSNFRLHCHLHHCLYNCICEEIEIVENVKYLGLTIDRNLKWDSHIRLLSSKLMKINYALYFLRGFLKPEFLKQLYYSWFEGTMRYGIIHFGGTYQSLLKPVELAQKFAVRNIHHLRKFDAVTYLFEQDNIFTFKQLYELSTLVFIKKHIDDYEFKQPQLSTRASTKISIILPNFVKEMARKQFCYSGVKVFNEFLANQGNDLLFEGKPKFKMKVKQYIKG